MTTTLIQTVETREFITNEQRISLRLAYRSQTPINGQTIRTWDWRAMPGGEESITISVVEGVFLTAYVDDLNASEFSDTQAHMPIHQLMAYCPLPADDALSNW
jgi:hypothetical protein